MTDPKYAQIHKHGFVRLVDSMGNDLSVVRAARVSHDAAWRAGSDTGSDERLIHYLMKNFHTTPFEMVEFTFEVRMPIFIARQWVRHRTASINEVSARYTQLPGDFYLPEPRDIGAPHSTHKQTRELNIEMTPLDIQKREAEIMLLNAHCQQSYALYDHLLGACGWPRELARMCLPLNVYTHWFWKIDLKNLLHFLDLRHHSHAQKEIRDYAGPMLEMVRAICPISVAAWEEYRPHKEN